MSKTNTTHEQHILCILKAFTRLMLVMTAGKTFVRPSPWLTADSDEQVTD